MAKIFLTGATGYLGGDALHALHGAHPEYRISALVRDPAGAAGAALARSYPEVRVVAGGLDDGELMAREAAGADVVLNLAATSHLPSVRAIRAGLKTKGKRGAPAHWIQMSGATVLACAEIASGTFGEPPPADDGPYDDLDGAAAFWAQVAKYPGRAVDNFVRETAANDADIRTALLVGPIIYGAGRGPGNTRSIQIPELARTAIERRRAWQVGRGLAEWDNVHVRDLSDMTLRLVERAVGGGEQGGVWSMEGVYLAGAGGRISFGDISHRIATTAAALGLAESRDVDALPAEEADKLVGHAGVLLGTNARGREARVEPETRELGAGDRGHGEG